MTDRTVAIAFLYVAAVIAGYLLCHLIEAVHRRRRWDRDA